VPAATPLSFVTPRDCHYMVIAIDALANNNEGILWLLLTSCSLVLPLCIDRGGSKVSSIFMASSGSTSSSEEETSGYDVIGT